MDDNCLGRSIASTISRLTISRLAICGLLMNNCDLGILKTLFDFLIVVMAVAAIADCDQENYTTKNDSNDCADRKSSSTKSVSAIATPALAAESANLTIAQVECRVSDDCFLSVCCRVVVCVRSHVVVAGLSNTHHAQHNRY